MSTSDSKSGEVGDSRSGEADDSEIGWHRWLKEQRRQRM